MSAPDLRLPRAALLATFLFHSPVVQAAVVEVGRDDERVSFHDGSGSADAGADLGTAAHDGLRGRLLVVWRAFETAGSGELEPGLFARFVSERGEALGVTVPIFGGATFSRPVLLHNPARDEFLAVFDVPHSRGVDVLALRLDASTALPLTGPVTVQMPGRSGISPAAVRNGAGDEYLVAWSGDTAERGVEIVTQRLAAADLAPLGVDDRVVSRIGPDRDDTYSAMVPRLAYNPAVDEYLVAFLATPSAGPGAIADHFEVHVQRLTASTGEEVGADDLRVSAMGPLDDPGSSAGACDVAFDSHRNRYLLAWEGHRSDDESSPFETEIYSQALDGATAAEVGLDDLRLTEVGGLGVPGNEARGATLLYDPEADRYVLLAVASFFVDDLPDAELLAVEIDPGSGLPASPRLVSRSGGEEFVERRAYSAAGAAASAGGALLAVWHGEGDDGGMVAGEREIFAQPLRAGALFIDDFETGNLDRWFIPRPGP